MKVTAVLIVLFLPVLAFAGSIENTQQLELPVKDIQSIHIICGPGFLDVFGIERGDRIKVTATVKIIRMSTGRVSISDGSGTVEATDIVDNLEVKDGSGRIDIGGVTGNVRIVDGSGSMTVTDIDGNLTVRDGSGSIEISDVTQNVFIIETGSGTLEIEGVKGKVITQE